MSLRRIADDKLSKEVKVRLIELAKGALRSEKADISEILSLRFEIIYSQEFVLDLTIL